MSRFVLLSLALVLCGMSFTHAQIPWSTMYHANPVLNYTTSQTISTGLANYPLSGVLAGPEISGQVAGHIVAFSGDCFGPYNVQANVHVDPYQSYPQNDYYNRGLNIGQGDQVISPIMSRMYTESLGDAIYLFYRLNADPSTLLVSATATADTPGGYISDIYSYTPRAPIPYKSYIMNAIAIVSFNNDTIYVAIENVDNTVSLFGTSDMITWQVYGYVTSGDTGNPIRALGNFGMVSAATYPSNNGGIESLWFFWVDSTDGSRRAAPWVSQSNPTALKPSTRLGYDPTSNNLGITASSSANGLTVLLIQAHKDTTISPSGNVVFYSIFIPTMNAEIIYETPLKLDDGTMAVTSAMPGIAYTRLSMAKAFGQEPVAVAWANYADNLLYSAVSSPFF